MGRHRERFVARERALAAKGRIIPDTPYELDKLRAMDADVRLRAQRINAPRLPIDDMDAHLLLDDGVLRLAPLDFGVAGGRIRSTVHMDARDRTIRTRLQASVRQLDLGGLFPDSTLAGQAVGKIGGEFTLAGSGNSVAAMLGGVERGDLDLQPPERFLALVQRREVAGHAVETGDGIGVGAVGPLLGGAGLDRRVGSGRFGHGNTRMAWLSLCPT